MKRIGTVDHLFHDGDPIAGTLGTIVDAAWLNPVQEEIAGAIEQFGPLDDNDSNQLAKILASSRRNLLTGGNFSTNPFQRGSASLAVTVSGSFVADRWHLEFDGAPTITRDIVSVALGSKLLGVTVRQALKLTVTAKGGATYIRLGQRIERVDTLTDANAAVSTAIQGNKVLNVPLRLVQCFGTGGAPSANVITAGTQALAVTAAMAELYSDIAVPAITGKTLGSSVNTDYLELQYDLSALGAGDYVIIPLAQLQGAYYPTPFEARDPATELALCQRYFEKSYDPTTPPGTAIAAAGNFYGAAFIPTTTGALAGTLQGQAFFRTTKRIAPSMTLYSPVSGAVGKGAGPGHYLDVDVAAAYAGAGGFVMSGTAAADEMAVYVHWTANAEL